MTDILNILSCAFKLAFLASLERKYYFEVQTHEWDHKVFIGMHKKNI